MCEKFGFQVLKNEIDLFVGQVDTNALELTGEKSCIMAVLHLSYLIPLCLSSVLPTSPETHSKSQTLFKCFVENK